MLLLRCSRRCTAIGSISADGPGRGHQKEDPKANGGAGYRWPTRTDAEAGPMLMTGRYLHWLEHPIADPRTALSVEATAAVMADVLRCADPERDLKLIHQNHRRTDPSPGPYPELEDGEFVQGDQVRTRLHVVCGIAHGISHWLSFRSGCTWTPRSCRGTTRRRRARTSTSPSSR